jgi:hypothetical protein
MDLDFRRDDRLLGAQLLFTRLPRGPLPNRLCGWGQIGYIGVAGMGFGRLQPCKIYFCSNFHEK